MFKLKYVHNSDLLRSKEYYEVYTLKNIRIPKNIIKCKIIGEYRQKIYNRPIIIGLKTRSDDRPISNRQSN